LSGNNRHGTLINFAYEGVSGYQENGTGGILLDDVDDKIVRPAIPNIQYTSASKNLFNKYGNLNEKPSTDSGTYENTTYDAANDLIVTLGVSGVRYGYGQKIAVKRNTNYVCKATAIGVTQRISIRKDASTATPLADWNIGAGLSDSRTFNSGENDFVYFIPLTGSVSGTYGIRDVQLEEGTSANSYTPYIPSINMTYQLNSNMISFNGREVRFVRNGIVVKRNGINLIRNSDMLSGDKKLVTVPTSVIYAYKSVPVLGRPYKTPDSFYLSGEVEASEGISGFGIYLRDFTSGIKNGDLNIPPVSIGNPFKYEKIVKLPEGVNNDNLIIVTRVEGAAKSFVKFSKLQLINLTEVFGAGNEPDLTTIQSESDKWAWTPNPLDLIESESLFGNLLDGVETLQGNDFEQHEDGVTTYTNEAEEGSVVRVDIDGISEQPLRFRTAEGEQLVITEHDTGDSIKKIEFCGNSVQAADKYREVSGTSATIALELHDKTVADKVVIGGNTTQYMETSNVVMDGLEMWLSGRNFTNNPTTTVWKDLTGINNGAVSGFAYTSVSGSDGAGGIVFDGVDDGVIGLPSQTVYDYSSFTLEVKCVIDSTAVATSIILGNRYREGVTSSFFKLTPNMFEYYVDSVQHGIVNAVTKNTLVHLTIVKDKNTLKYFTNGVLTSSKTLPIGLAMPPMPFGIGKDPFNTSTPEPFKGKINFVRKYGRALTDAEVLQNYNAGLAIPIPNIAMPQEIKHISSGSKVLVRGKNIFNVEKVANSAYLTDMQNGFRISNNYANGAAYAMYLKPNTTYTMTAQKSLVSGTINETIGGSIRLYNQSISASIEILSQGMGNTVKTFTTPSNVEEMYIMYIYGSSTGVIDFLNMQLEEGSIQTSYETYTETEINIPVTLRSIG